MGGRESFGSLLHIGHPDGPALVESLAIELSRDSIPVFAVNPGLVPTGIMSHLLDDPHARRFLPRFTEAFAEGKEVSPDFAATMAVWLMERRPPELNGRVISALLSPDYLETRLDRIAKENLGRLRLH